MNRRTLFQAATGLLLAALGYFVAHREPYEVHTVLASAGGCQMATDIYEPRSGSPVGSVVLLHGLAANKKVMAFNAQEFANSDLRVFVPDLPGHGRTPGPFSPARAEYCVDALLRDLAARKAIVPERSLLAGHSLGAAIALRTARAIPLSGVIAISPAPMRAVSGFSEEMLPFHEAPPLPAHSLVLTGSWEPGSIKMLARQMVESAPDSSSRYQLIAGTTHVSILFSAKTFAAIGAWCSQLLGSNPQTRLPGNRPALACILGIIGLSLLVPPFLNEMNPAAAPSPAPQPSAPSYAKALLVTGAAALASALLLAWRAVPVHLVRIFQGDYLAVFLFCTGLAILGLAYSSLPALKSQCKPALGSACASALVLVLLFAGWFELTFYEAWLTPARWLRFPLLLLLLLPWHLAEELLLGRCSASPDLRRLAKAGALRAVVYAGLFLGVRFLHSGAVLLFLLLAYLVAFTVLQRLACDLVRFRTQSSAAAAIFGAILLAAFVLAIFPVA